MRLINHILAAVFVGTVTFTMAWPKTMAFAADPAFQVVAGQRQLFLDDVDIVKIENLTRTMQQPKIQSRWSILEHRTSNIERRSD